MLKIQMSKVSLAENMNKRFFIIHHSYWHHSLFVITHWVLALHWLYSNICIIYGTNTFYTCNTVQYISKPIVLAQGLFCIFSMWHDPFMFVGLCFHLVHCKKAIKETTRSSNSTHTHSESTSYMVSGDTDWTLTGSICHHLSLTALWSTVRTCMVVFLSLTS